MDKEKREHPEELTSSDQDFSRTEIPEAADTDEHKETKQASDAYESAYPMNQAGDKFAEEELPAQTSLKAEPEKRYAGFWMRFWAYIVDLIVVFSVTGLLVHPFMLIDAFGEATIWMWSVSGLLGGLIFFAYFLLMTKWRGQTLGKMIFGLRVIRKDGGRLSWSDTLIREVVGRFIHRLLFLFILYAVVAFTPNKQGLHDIFADTLVIHE